jgi:hypothetical protein
MTFITLKVKILENKTNYKSLAALKPEDLSRISKICYGHLYLREENLRLRSPIPEGGETYLYLREENLTYT